MLRQETQINTAEANPGPAGIHAAIRALNLRSGAKPAPARKWLSIACFAAADASATSLIAAIPAQGWIVSLLLGGAAGAITLLSAFLIYERCKS